MPKTTNSPSTLHCENSVLFSRLSAVTHVNSTGSGLSSTSSVGPGDHTKAARLEQEVPLRAESISQAPSNAFYRKFFTLSFHTMFHRIVTDIQVKGVTIRLWY